MNFSGFIHLCNILNKSYSVQRFQMSRAWKGVKSHSNGDEGGSIFDIMSHKGFPSKYESKK